MAKAEGLLGGKAPAKAFSSKLLQMKFMQRRATQTAAAKQEAEVQASHHKKWTYAGFSAMALCPEAANLLTDWSRIEGQAAVGLEQS